MEEQLYHRFYEIEDKHWWFVARRTIINYLVTHSCNLQQGARMLDVGCGTGAVLAGLSKLYDTYGIDTSEVAIEYCRKRGLANVYACNLENFPHSSLHFDLIMMLDVIEHTDDELGTLHQAYDRLTPEGRILLTVPAYQFLWGPHDVMNKHKRRYTRKRLKIIMEQSGFVIEKLSYMNSILFPLALVQRGIQSFSAQRHKKLLVIPPASINNLLKSIFTVEMHLLRVLSFPYGLTVLGIGRKG
jgi:SAM-dependent methyltransferase